MRIVHHYCSHCHNKIDPKHVIQCQGELLCPDCADELTVVCDCCGALEFLDNCECDERRTLCRYCMEHYYHRCTSCNRLFRNSDITFDTNDNPYCGDCFEKKNLRTAIHEFDYRPKPIFYGEGNRFLGVELEIDGNGTDTHYANLFLSTGNRNAEHIYIKKDGSLDCGMELVTHPMTLDYHMNHMPWAELLKEVLAIGYRSHQAGTCGLHVHVSRSAFGDTLQQQEESIARLLYFVEKFWSEMLLFSRRTERQMKRWASRYGLCLSPFAILDHAKDSDIGRYAAVNLTNQTTIEIRLFRGSLKLNTVLATLQMVNAMCDVAVFLSDDYVKNMSWHDFLNRITEPELIQYLKERNLYKNEPVTTEEEL